MFSTANEMFGSFGELLLPSWFESVAYSVESKNNRTIINFYTK